jgi:F-box protein 9
MSEAELERFRREWQEEVRARDRRVPEKQVPRPQPSSSSSGNAYQASRPAPQPPKRGPEVDDRVGYNFDNLEELEQNRTLGISGDGVHPEAAKRKEPTTALEYYERAVESETQGKLGESVAHYRRAFRLNDRVDQQYRNKHFPPTAFKPSQSKHTRNAPSNASQTVPNPAHASLRSGEHGQSAATPALIASFASERIHGAPPTIARDIPPPCPMSSVPSELLTEILRFTAMSDVASFVRLSSVCKRFAYLVSAEAGLWKEICLNSRFGFNSMHYEFACSLEGTPTGCNVLADFEDLTLEDQPSDTDQTVQKNPLSHSLALSPSYPSYVAMFHHRPRLRFAGVYISTVNYIRPGAASPNQITWNSPLHIVTYYRYLRFFRDGSCISLLTTVEPLEVVPHFHVDHIGETPGGLASAGLAAVGRYTLRGRWRMSPPHPPPNTDKDAVEDGEELEPEGNILVETYGPTPPLIYHMQLALRSNSGKGPKNTKLVWQGFWSYNKITDDWAEFGLRNDRAYVWSRVKSWSDV